MKRLVKLSISFNARPRRRCSPIPVSSECALENVRAIMMTLQATKLGSDRVRERSLADALTRQFSGALGRNLLAWRAECTAPGSVDGKADILMPFHRYNWRKRAQVIDCLSCRSLAAHDAATEAITATP